MAPGLADTGRLSTVVNRSSTSQQYRLKAMRMSLALVLALPILLALPALACAEPIKPAALRITIDPGHGGGYSGAVYGGTSEKALNLQIAKRLATELKRRGHRVDMTRWTDSYVYSGGTVPTWRWVDSLDRYKYDSWPVNTATDRLRRDLQSRCDRANANGADLFVSIHNNAGGSASGAETYRAPQDPLGQRFASDVQAELISETGARSRGVFAENFYVIRWSNMPAVLVECGFMSNSSELSRLRSSSYQATVARGIADGIDRFAKREFDESFDRIWGADRYSTAAQVARSGWATPTVAFLSSGETFADSLVAGPYATQLDAPILLTAAGHLPGPTASALKDLAPDRIVVVGGPRSVPDAIARQAAQAAGIDPAAPGAITRFGGSTRYDVALAIAEEMGIADDAPVIVASGEVFPDALSISAYAAENAQPILLVSSKKMSGGIRSYISRGERDMTVVGGPATIPEQVLDGFEYERLAGSNRYSTNWAVFANKYEAEDHVRPMIASAEVFPDALVLGPYAAKQGRPIILMGKSACSTSLRPWVYNNREAELDVDVVGGPASVSAYVSQMFEKWRMNQH